MFRILLADNEGIVLDALTHMIQSRYGEACDIRTAATAANTRALARKFVPDIAVINIEMPGLMSFDIVREIRSYHIKCVFITVSTYERYVYRTEAKSLNLLAHIVKPLFREKIFPVLEDATSLVSQHQKRLWQQRLIQEKFDTVVPVLEHGFIQQLFFPENRRETLQRYLEILNISQPYGKLITLTFGEAASDSGLPLTAGVLGNPVGAAVRLQKNYSKFREIVREFLPLSIIGPVMSNHVLLVIPCWKEAETADEKNQASGLLSELLDALKEGLEPLIFLAAEGEVQPLVEMRIET